MIESPIEMDEMDDMKWADPIFGNPPDDGRNDILVEDDMGMHSIYIG